MKTHYIKCWPEYYTAIATTAKKFDLRKDDRNYQVNDTVVLQEYDPNTERYTANELKMRITYILRGAKQFGLMDGYCILSLKFLP